VKKKAKPKGRRNNNKNVKEKVRRRKSEEKGKSFLPFLKHQTRRKQTQNIIKLRT
jgi:hypothetical protein